VAARVPKDPVEDVARTVYHRRLIVKTRSRCDVSRDSQDALNPVEGSEGDLEHRECVERAHLGGFSPLLYFDCVSERS
jgi:hypothetical protein